MVRRVARVTVLPQMGMLSIGGRLLLLAAATDPQRLVVAAATENLWEHAWRDGRVRLLDLGRGHADFASAPLASVVALQRLAHRRRMRRRLALAMALHPRLGAASAMSWLGADLLAGLCPPP